VVRNTFYALHVHAFLTNLLCTGLVGCNDAYVVVVYYRMVYVVARVDSGHPSGHRPDYFSD